MVSRGENIPPSDGEGGVSISCNPGALENASWNGLLVMVSTRGDMSASSSE